MAQLTLRSTRDSALTWEEGDANLLALDSDSPWKVSSDHITYNGKVGIGVDSTYVPVYDLDFGDGDSATVGITNGDLVVHVDGPNELKVWNNTVQSITVKTTGKVGINNSNPSEMLTVGGNLRVSDTSLANVMSANSFTDGIVSISGGNITTVRRLDVENSTVEVQFGNLYSKRSGRRIEDWDSSLSSFPYRVPTSEAVYLALGAVDSNLTSRLDSYELSTNSRLDSFELSTNTRFDSFELSTNTRFDSFETSILSRFDSFETQVSADFTFLETNLQGQIDSLDTSLNLQISNLINDQNDAFDSLELSLQTQINTLETNINNQFDSFETKINFQFNSLETNLQGQIDSLDTSLNLQITNLINDQNNAFDSLEGSINATLASYDLDGVLAVGNSSTRDMTVGTVNSAKQVINSTSPTTELKVSGIKRGITYFDGTNNRYRISVYDAAGANAQSSALFYHGGGVDLRYAGTQKFITQSNGVKITGQVTASGDVVAFSDVAFKEEINPIVDALGKVSQLGGYTFKRKEDDSRKYTGVLAQEVQKVLPEAVHSSEEGLSVAYGNLTGLLIEAVKELSAKVKELESK